MNKDQVKGRVEQVKGKIKEAAGKVTDNTTTNYTLSLHDALPIFLHRLLGVAEALLHFSFNLL